MTESTNTMTNCRQSGNSSTSSNNIVNLVVALTLQQEYVTNDNGSFYGDRHHLTLSDLKPVPISDHDLCVFDELSHQSNAVLHSSNLHPPSEEQQKARLTIEIDNFHSSYLMPTTTTMNDYERRFQRSLQKLTIPSWYTDVSPSSNLLSSSKQSILSTAPVPWKGEHRETQRTPEIIHVRRPHSYRSCRSSLATSPSPSVHSWHPNHIMDGVNFSLLIPSSSRRYNKYEKGIERVSKSSRWYQPTQFDANKTGTVKISTSTKHKQQPTKNNHYDTPKIHYGDENLISKSNCSVTNGDVENTIVNEQNNNMIINDKQQDNHLKSNESQIMPLANTKESFSYIELDEDDNLSLTMISNKSIPSMIEQSNHNELLERTANDLVESVLADILFLKNLDKDDDDDEDKNSGVRELSEDENGLRELDENDMNDTDEFIVFATKAETPDDDDQTMDIPRNSLNRLYTFSKINDNGIDNSKQLASNQNSPRSILEKDFLTINSQSEQPFDQLSHLPSIYQSPIEKQHINYEPYSNGIIRPSDSQLLTHPSSEGVNEETARIGRLLLDSIPTSFIENIHNLSQTPISTPSIIKKTRSVISDQDDSYESTREEHSKEFNDKVRRDSAYSSNQEKINIQHSFYEPLSECYSGYSFIQSDFLTPNISSIQSTTDEAYESEPTTMSSSIATTTTAHVHPDLEHEFEYPSPPPPVPDRRLKPAHLKPFVPPTKPRLIKQDHIDLVGYSTVQKSKPVSFTTIQQLITSPANDSTSLSTKTTNSRNYCGTIPVVQEISQSPIKTNGHSKDKSKEKRSSRTLNCLHSSATDDDNKRNTNTKSSSSSLNKTKIKKQKLNTNFDEATNGLAIRLPAPVSNGHDSNSKQNLNRTMTSSSSIKRAKGMTKNQQITDNIKSDRLPFYETSV